MFVRLPLAIDAVAAHVRCQGEHAGISLLPLLFKACQCVREFEGQVGALAGVVRQVEPEFVALELGYFQSPSRTARWLSYL